MRSAVCESSHQGCHITLITVVSLHHIISLFHHSSHHSSHHSFITHHSSLITSHHITHHSSHHITSLITHHITHHIHHSKHNTYSNTSHQSHRHHTSRAPRPSRESRSLPIPSDTPTPSSLMRMYRILLITPNHLYYGSIRVQRTPHACCTSQRSTIPNPQMNHFSTRNPSG